MFRSDCGANGPCTYTLIDKYTGNKVKEFNELICIDSEDDKYKFDFIVYLTEAADYCVVYFVDREKSLNIPFTESLTSSACPQQQFEGMALKNNILELTYWTNDKTKNTLSINLEDEKYSR